MTVNKATLIGRLGDEPDLRYMTTGDAVCNVSIATSEQWKDKAGEKQERTEWHRLVFYRKLADIAGKHLVKGSLIYVEGKIQTRKWQDKEGKDHYTTEIIVQEMKMLGSKPQGTGQSSAPAAQPPKDGAPPPTQSFDNFDSDIPF